MNVLFRVDASSKIGTGHVMRCLTLANELRHQGDNTNFCCRHITQSLEELIVSSGHKLFKLITNKVLENNDVVVDQYVSWLGVSQITDVNDLVSSTNLEIIDWIVIDHYSIGRQWHKVINKKFKGIKLLVINDLFEKHHYCNVFLNQNIVINKNNAYKNKLEIKDQMLIGPQYALLRDEFQLYRSTAKVRVRVKRILIFFGGIDITNATGKTISALSKFKNDNFIVEVVVGAGHPNLDEIKDQCARQQYNLNIQITNMAELMTWADLSIGASGSASWERSCLGLPSIVIALAENQILIAEACEGAGIIEYLGEDINVTQAEIACAVSTLYREPHRLMLMSEACLASADANGKARVAAVMRGLS